MENSNDVVNFYPTISYQEKNRHTYIQTKEFTSEKNSCLIKSKKRKKQNKTKQNYTKKRKAKTKQQTEKWKKTENKIKIGNNITSGHLEKKQNKE